jgi:hypothetical protein
MTSFGEQQARIPPAAIVGATAIAVMGGLAVAAGRGVVAIALASIPLALFVVPRVSRAAGLPRGYFSIEVPVVLLLLSTLVFRIRGAEALSDDPLDSAAMYRLACIGGAALLGWLTLLREPAAAEPVRTPPPVFLYGAYVAVVFLGAPLSLNLPLTAYRGLELMVGLLVVVAAVQYGGRDAILRLERAVYAFLVLLILSVWAGVLLFPGEAVFRDVSPIPFQIQGLYPAVSPNGVGETGAILFLWSLGVRVSGRSVGRWNTAFITLGLVTLVAGQYRTGYLACAAALTLLLVARGRRALAIVAAASVLAAAVWSGSAITNAAEPYVLRGQSLEQAEQLSGRIHLWQQALPVWRESPVLGKGLLTGTRFEVLAPLGFTTVSTIHGTWVEALVGTGVVGVVLLAAFLLALWRASLADLLGRSALVYPALLVVFFTVRSITGPSFEVFGVAMVLLLMLVYRLALAADEERSRAARPGA